MTVYDSSGRDEVAILIRLPRGLKARVQEMALAERRSMNQQVVILLGESVSKPEPVRITQYVEPATLVQGLGSRPDDPDSDDDPRFE